MTSTCRAGWGEGYAVVASDYVGLGTPGLMSYLNSVTTAHGVIDSVIAAHDMGLPLREARPDLDINSVLSPAGRNAADRAETSLAPWPLPTNSPT